MSKTSFQHSRTAPATRKISTTRKILSCALSAALALMLVPFIPSNPLGEYDVPAYASDGTDLIYESTETYIENRLDGDRVDAANVPRDSDGSMVPRSKLYIQYTFIDKNMAQGYRTLDDVYEHVQEAVVASYPSHVITYDTGEENDYYVAFLDYPSMTKSADYLEATFNTYDVNNPINLNDQLVYDSENGIVYIPKTLDLTGLAEDEEGAAIQAQLTYEIAFDQNEETNYMTSMDLEIENNNENITAVYPSGQVSDDTFDITTTFPVATPETAGNISLGDLHLYLNDVDQETALVEGETAIYDSETGELTVTVSPINVSKARIVIDNAPKKANAVTIVSSPAALAALPNSKLENIDIDTLKNGQVYRYTNSQTWGSSSSNDASRNYMYVWDPGASGAGSSRDVGDWLHWERFKDDDTFNFDYFARKVDALGSAYSYGLILHSSVPAAIIASGTVPNGVCYNNGGTGSIAQDFGPASAWGDYQELCGQCSHSNEAERINVDEQSLGKDSFVGTRSNCWQFIRILAHTDEYMTICFQFPINNSQQAAGIYKVNIESKGMAKLKKSSANTSLTSGNTQYDLTGAYYDVYGSYTDAQNRINAVASIGPTNSVGETAEIQLKKGTYYVRERPGTAPKGYQLDLGTYTVDILPGQTTEVPVVDKPSGGGEDHDGPSAGFNIVKRDYNRQADGTKNGAQGAASLAGATFKVTYYDNQNLNSIAAARSATPYSGSYAPLKPRYITTTMQADGTVKAKFNVESVEVGTELPTDSTGADKKYMLAIGSYLIEEFKAPTGYSNYFGTPNDPLTKYNEKMAILLRVTQTENGQKAHVKWVDGTNSDKTYVTTTTTGNKAQDISPNVNDLVITDIIPRGDISIIKYGEPTTNPDLTPDKKVPLAGVQFQIVNKSPNPVMNVQTGAWVPTNGVVYTLTTDDQGFATTRWQMTDTGRKGIQNTKDTTGGALAYGNYELREIKGPAQDLGYELMDPIPFSISDNYQHVTMTLENKIGTVVQIKKVDAETGKAVRGTAKFRILDSNKKVMTFDDFYPSSAKVSVFTTGIDGIAKLPAKFMPGTYYIQEVEGPEGYLWSDKLIPFTCTTDTVKKYGEYANPMTVEFSDYAAKGQITITKTDERTDQPITEAAATYGVYAAEDIVTQDGTTRAKQGDKVDTVVTSMAGTGASKELYLGHYYIQEETAPTGYLLDESKIDVMLKYAGDRVEVVNEPVEVSDEAVEGEITGTKIDDKSLNQIRYAGAVFDVVAAENITGGDGYVWHTKGEVVDTITTDSEGNARPNVKLELGKYQVIERKAPYGYVLNSTPVDVELKYADQYTPLVSGVAELHDLFTTTDLTIQKLDRETGKTVFTPGCEIAVFANEDIRTLDGTVHYHKDDWVGSAKTDETGKVTTDFKMPVGKYRLQEVNAPEGYVLDEQRQYEVEIPWDGGLNGHNIYDAAVSDVPAKGIITFTKVDAETGRAIALPGIKAEVYANEDIVTGDGTVRYTKDQKVADLVTDDAGFAQTSELYLGNYRVVETFAPTGYLLNSTPVDVSLVYESQTVPVVFAGSQIADENAKGIIEVTKIDKETGKTVPLTGARFEVRAKTDIITGDGTVRLSAGELACEPIETDENGICKTPELYLGIYTITEIQAPYGYTLDTTGYDAVLAYKDQYTPIVTASESVANVPQKGVIQVTKVDDESKLPIVKPGATFEIKATEDIITPDGTLRVKAGEVVDTIETDETSIASSKALYLGKYEVYETQAPEGYLLTDEIKQVELVYGEQTEPLVYEMVAVEDHAVKGTITIHKEDTDLEEALPNVEYEIRAAEDIITGDSVTHHKAGDVVETIITDEEGNATSGELYLGRYVVVETVQPNGYELDTKEYPVELIYADQMTPLVHEDVFLYNTPSSVKIKKVSLSNLDEAVENTQFIGWEADDEIRYEGKIAVFADGTENKISAVSISYMGALDSMKPESAEPEKTFELAKDDSADSDYEVWSTSEKAVQGAYVMHIAYTHAGTTVEDTVAFTVNEYDVNAIFALGSIVASGNRANCFAHGADATEPNIPEDDSNSNTPDESVDITILADEENDANEPSTDDSDESDKDVATDDADNKDENDAEDEGIVKRVPVVLSSGKFVFNITGEDGMCEFKYIPQGKIGFAEFKPAEGYVSDRTPQYATFDANGTIAGTDIEGNAFDGKDMSTEEQILDLVYADDQTKLHISKQDVTNSQELPGNVLSVYEAKTEGTVDTDGDIASEDYGKHIETWTSTDEVHYMELLPQGSYILKEEQAVDGYTIAEDVKFQVNDTGVVQQVKMYNEHEAAVADELVETMGEMGDLIPFMIFMSMVAAASIGIIFRHRRRMM